MIFDAQGQHALKVKTVDGELNSPKSRYHVNLRRSWLTIEIKFLFTTHLPFRYINHIGTYYSKN